MSSSMPWWVTGIVRWAGNDHAVENVRLEIERRRLSLEAVDAATRRVAPDREFDRRDHDAA